jgi:hypothetical protein
LKKEVVTNFSQYDAFFSTKINSQFGARTTLNWKENSVPEKSCTFFLWIQGFFSPKGLENLSLPEKTTDKKS